MCYGLVSGEDCKGCCLGSQHVELLSSLRSTPVSSLALRSARLLRSSALLPHSATHFVVKDTLQFQTVSQWAGLGFTAWSRNVGLFAPERA